MSVKDDWVMEGKLAYALRLSRQQQKGRNGLLDFTLATYPEFSAQWYHIYLCECLDKFARREIKRLMVFMPPRHGKSELVSRRLPAYLLGINPDNRIVSASYSADLASQMNRDVQRIIDSPQYNKIFPDTTLSGSNVRTVAHGSYLRNNDIFEVVNHKGYYRSAGVGGALTGSGMDYGIIDDPIKNRKEANSITFRNALWEWYTSVFYTRQEKDACILLTLTRWNEDDLAGRLLERAKHDPDADQWVVVRFPAIAETSDENPKPGYDEREIGEPLWKDKFSISTLNTIRATMTTYEWGGLYQQRPKAPEGNRFKRQWFSHYQSEVPDRAKFVRYWDKAGTDNDGAYTAGVLMATHEKRFYIVDVQRQQLSAHARENLIKATAELDRAKYGKVTIWIEQEPGSAGKESAQNTIGNLAGFTVKADRPTGDKDTRLDGFEAQCEAGNITMIRGDWNYAFIEELVALPNGQYRDQSDATSGAFNALCGKLRSQAFIDYNNSTLMDYRG